MAGKPWSLEIEAADCTTSLVRKQEINTGLGSLSLFDSVPTPWNGVHIRAGGLHLAEPPWKPNCDSRCNPTDDNSPSHHRMENVLGLKERQC